MIKTTILKDGKRVPLRKHQKDAVHSVITHLKTKSPRASISHCCRSGKSLTAVTLHKSLKSRASVVFLPNLNLVEQTIHDWTPNLQRTKVLVVCSDKSTSGEVVSSPKEVKEFIQKCGDSKFVIFCTYDSSKKICQALQLLNGFSFDFLVADEAHRASGVNLKKSKFIHYDDCIRATNRLYMTATPKVISQHLQDQLHESSNVFSMDDKTVFGEQVHTYSFKEGIEDGILSDYKIIALGCKNPSDVNILEDAKDADHKHIIETAKLKALKKALLKHKIDHCITFHSSVKKALFFKNELRAKGWKTFHINSNMNSEERKLEIEAFKKAKKAVMTNCRCLSEGVNIMECDSVFFSDTKSGAIDVVQSASRPLTLDLNKPKGFKNLMLIPTFHNATDSVDDIVNTSAYQTLIKLVRHMRGIDDRIDAFLMHLARGCDRVYDLSDQLIEFDGFAKLQKHICSRIIPHDIVTLSDQELWDAYLDAGNNEQEAQRNLGVGVSYIKSRRFRSPWLDGKIRADKARSHISNELLIETLHKTKGNRRQACKLLKPHLFENGKGGTDFYQIRMTHNEDFKKEVYRIASLYDTRLTDDEVFEVFVKCKGNRDKTHVALGYEPRAGFLSKRYRKNPAFRKRCLDYKEHLNIEVNKELFKLIVKHKGNKSKASVEYGKGTAFIPMRLRAYPCFKEKVEKYLASI